MEHVHLLCFFLIRGMRRIRELSTNLLALLIENSEENGLHLDSISCCCLRNMRVHPVNRKIPGEPPCWDPWVQSMPCIHQRSKIRCIWSRVYRRHLTSLGLLPQIAFDYGTHFLLLLLSIDRQRCKCGWYYSPRENLDAVTEGL